MEQLRDMDMNDEGDYASVNIDSALDSAIGHQQQVELLEIENSLEKIRTNTFGICEMCEEDISIQRLKVKPQAQYCIECRGISVENIK